MRFDGRKWEIFRKAMIVLMASGMIWSIVASLRVGQNQNRLPPGTEVPPATLHIITGDLESPDGKVKLSDFEGKGVLLNFWGTWCGPCVAELPLLQRLQDDYAGAHFQVIGITDEHPVGVRRFIEKRGISFPIVHDPNGSLARKLGVQRIPYTAYVGPDGKLVGDHQGVLRSSAAASMVEKLIDAAKDY